MQTSKPVPTVAMGPYMTARSIAKRIISGFETPHAKSELIRDLLGMSGQLQPSERMQIYKMVKKHPDTKGKSDWGTLIQFSGAEDVVPAINLDCMTTAEEYQDCAYILHLLSAYCDAKASACKLRLAGDIEAAKSYEASADSYYEKLPEWARW